MHQLDQTEFAFETRLKFYSPMLIYEEALWRQGVCHIAGVDEAGRGPLAGPVFAAAVILSPDSELDGVTDSKQLSPRKREELFDIIFAQALAVGIGRAEHDEIDKINILQATYLAMNRALEQLHIKPQHVLVDGSGLPENGFKQSAIIGGDRKSLSIAAASIIAKVSRDRVMLSYHRQYPQYGFEKHKGYPSQMHIDSIKKFGYCPIHRRSFHVKQLADAE
ncbi:ribonuclease HII [candidate division KSB1 bacterium]|nr:ribonuclease HII [candidate division KSB1 bacterium]